MFGNHALQPRPYSTGAGLYTSSMSLQTCAAEQLYILAQIDLGAKFVKASVMTVQDGPRLSIKVSFRLGPFKRPP
jgi:hypothetical protein